MDERPCILVVDDDEGVRRSLSLILGKKGYAVSTAQTGQEALERAREKPFGVVLLDVRLPDMEGVELLTPLRDLHPGVAVIFITGHASVRTAVQAPNAGAWGYITNPLDVDQVLASVEGPLEKQRLVAEKRRAEEQLRQSDAALKQAQRIAHLGSWKWHIQDNRLEWSDEMHHIFGIEKEGFSGEMKEVVERAIHPRDRAAVERANLSVIEDKEPVPLEYRVVWPDGTVRVVWAEAGELMLDEAGNPAVLSGIVQDITERKRVEEALRERGQAERLFQERLRTLLQVSNELSRIDSVDALCRQAVELGRARLGFDRLGIWFRSPDPDVVLGSWGTDEHGNVRDERVERLAVTGGLKEIFAQTQPLTLHWDDVDLRDGHGNVVGHGARAQAPMWDGEQAIGFVSLDNLLRCQPITDDDCELLNLYASTLGYLCSRKRVEEALRESEEQYRSLFEGVPVGLYRTTPQGQILDANPALVEMLGHPDRESLLAVNVFDIYVDPERRRQQQRLLAHQGVLHGAALQLRRYDGTVVWVRDTVRAAQDGEGRVLYFEGGLEDITAQVMAEKELAYLLAEVREQAQQMQQVMNAVPEGVLLLDADRRVVMVNAAAAEALAVLAGATVGDTLPRLGDRAIVDLFNSPPQGLWHEVSGGKQTFEVVARSVEGSLAWWVIVIRDVTQQREMEQRAQRQEQLAAVGRLAAGIAHDFNNLLQGIMSFSELLLGRPDMPEAAKKNLDLICQLGERAASITHQILDFTRQSTPEKQPLDLVPLVEEVGCILRDTTPGKIEFAVEHEPGEMHIYADSTQIQQVLVNLSINARDAMPDGGTLTLRLSRFVLRCGVPPPCAELSPGEWIRLEVCDTGIGIPPQILPHIFEPFFTTKEAKGGSGLGLAQAYGIVRQHDGYIDVETEEGRGTTFTIYLPALGEIEPDARELPETAPRGQGQMVLLVDDEPTVLQATSAVLERLGYGVLAATNGRDALRVFEQHRDGIDLALIDMIMPGMNGVELSRALRARDPTFKVVVTTGYPLDERAEELRDQGIVAWVQKPVKLAQLAHALGRALGHPAEG